MTARDVVSFGETMVLMDPRETGPLRYVDGFRKGVGGAESNVAIGLSNLGHDAGWFSRLGADPHGEFVRAFVRGEGVDTEHVRFDEGAPTGVYFKERRAVGEGRVFYYRHGSAASCLSPADVPEEYVADATYLHLTGITPALSASCREATDAALETAEEAGVAVTFDPNLRTKLWESDETMRETMREFLGRAAVALPGVEEGEAVFGVEGAVAVARACLEAGAGVAVVKRGAEGCYVADADGGEHVEGYDVSPVDHVGAGDGFAAGYLSGRLDGLDPVAAADRGNAVGALAVTVSGDVEGLPTRRDLEAFLGERERVRR